MELFAFNTCTNFEKKVEQADVFLIIVSILNYGKRKKGFLTMWGQTFYVKG